jgi:hypothetical protein
MNVQIAHSIFRLQSNLQIGITKRERAKLGLGGSRSRSADSSMVLLYRVHVRLYLSPPALRLSKHQLRGGLETSFQKK